MDTKNQKRIRRHKRVRAKVRGTSDRPRLSVFRSNKHLFMQVIDDDKNITVLGMGDLAKKSEAKSKKTKTDSARELGVSIAKAVSEKGIKKIVFDKGGYRYHGRVKAAAEGAREGGLEF